MIYKYKLNYNNRIGVIFVAGVAFGAGNTFGTCQYYAKFI